MRRVRIVTTSAAAVALLAACHPSASVERTMPVANLQTFRTLALRVRSTAFAAQGQAISLETAVTNQLRQRCSFAAIARPGAQPSDLVLDVNVTAVGRGGTGFLRNPNTATMDTLLVLSDGQDGELLGTARIRGKSSGMIVNNSVPENEAIEVVAKSIGDLLASSGCSGPRVARQEPAPSPPPVADATPPSDAGAGSAGSAAPPLDQPTDEARSQAEALNERGKDALYAADVAGSVAAFEKASALVPDPRYAFNLCLALGAQEQWDRAVAACQRARGLHPNDALAAKIDHRLDLLQHRQ